MKDEDFVFQDLGAHYWEEVDLSGLKYILFKWDVSCLRHWYRCIILA
jgi:hypothetical protein